MHTYPARLFVTSRGQMDEDNGTSHVAFSSAKDAIAYLDGADLGFPNPENNWDEDDGVYIEDGSIVEYVRVDRELELG